MIDSAIQDVQGAVRRAPAADATTYSGIALRVAPPRRRRDTFSFPSQQNPSLTNGTPRRPPVVPDVGLCVASKLQRTRQGNPS